MDLTDGGHDHVFLVTTETRRNLVDANSLTCLKLLNATFQTFERQITTFRIANFAIHP